MNGFTKLFSSIVTSTIWQEDPETKVIWITLLALSDAKGRVDGTIPGIANIANISIQKTEAAIEKFLGPDKYSRSQDNEGRRIKVIEGGWQLLNYRVYRDRGRKTPEYYRAYREKKAKEKERTKEKEVKTNTEEEAEAEAQPKHNHATVAQPVAVSSFIPEKGTIPNKKENPSTKPYIHTGNKEDIKTNRDVGIKADEYSRNKKPHTTTTTDRIVSAWQKLPLPQEKKAVDASCLLAIDRIVSELSADAQEPIHEGMILEAIENYGTALKLPHSQTFKHKIYPFLQRHVKKYVSYNFDIDHHDSRKFKKAGETESATDQVAELKARGEL